MRIIRRATEVQAVGRLTAENTHSRGTGRPSTLGPDGPLPSTTEAAELLCKGLEAIPVERLWVNPDCGLKTRAWPEIRTSLENLVTAALEVRGDLPATNP